MPEAGADPREKNLAWSCGTSKPSAVQLGFSAKQQSQGR